MHTLNSPESNFGNKMRILTCYILIYLGDRQRFLSCLLTLKVEIDEETLIPMNTLAHSTLTWLEKAADISSAKTIGEFV